MGMLFKRSVFGGFRQREVIEYIEKLRRDGELERRQLEQQLNQARQAEEEACQRQRAAETQAARLEQQLEQAREQIQTLEQQTNQALEQAEEAGRRALAVRREYGQLKEYIADIEISAYKRAREVQQEAARQARQAIQTIQDAGAVISPAADQARQQMAQAEQAFSGFKERIAAIAGEIDQLARAISDMEEQNPLKGQLLPEDWDSQPQSPGDPKDRLRSIQEILDKVKIIGEKMKVQDEKVESENF